MKKIRMMFEFMKLISLIGVVVAEKIGTGIFYFILLVFCIYLKEQTYD